MYGDILFVKPGPGWSDWQGNLIARATNGPYCHVEIDCGGGFSVGAQADGIQRHGAPGNATRWPIQTAIDIEGAAKINAAMDWVLGQIGDPYGYSDIASHVLKIVGVPFSIQQSKRYDCSDFATRYLMRAGFDVGALQNDPASVSPNELARQLGVLK